MTVRLYPYVVNTLMAGLVGHDGQPSAFLVYLALWRRTAGAVKAQVRVPLMDLAEATGLSKRTVQNALGWLHHRKLVSATRGAPTEVPAYRVHMPWKREKPTA